MTHYGMAIDTRRCVGCNACTTACKMANNVPAGVFWTRALTDGGDAPDTPAGTFPKVTMSYLTVGCQDYDKCIGCRMCMSACPYNGVRSFNWEEPAYGVDYALGDADAPKHQKHTVEKCTFCYQRISKGEEPACMDLCPARARHWGDLDDPDSEVSKLIASRSYKQLLPDMGTKPSVYYLV